MKYSADAECEIIHCVNCEISHFVRCEMKFALHICEANISQRSYFTWALPNFTRCRRISLKKAHLRCRCAFFWRRVDKKDAIVKSTYLEINFSYNSLVSEA